MPKKQIEKKSKARDSSAKKDEILNVAAELFLKLGYEGASVNEMARCSGISKETIYRHFKSKRNLFAEVVDKELNHYRSHLDYVLGLGRDADIKEALKLYGKALLKILLDKRTLALRGLIFLESGAQPELGKLYYNLGPNRGYKALEQYFAMKLQSGLKSRFDARKLSRYFAALIIYNLVLEYQCGINRKISEKQLDSHVEEVVDDFLSIYCE